jgi:ABC-2 type transport system ATP-binding protein
MNTAIETYDLKKYYGPVKAVNALNLTVRQGEIYGFLGRNGAGKTTTIRCLLGMIHPTGGTVKILGQTVKPGRNTLWNRVGHLVETPSAYPDLTVTENLEIARRLQLVDDRQAVSRVIDLLGLQPYAHRKAGVLSLGNLQRLGLARALLHKPELLILDEPANGLDPAGVVEIRELLETLVREQGVTILMSSHILTEVDRLAHRIGIIHNGRLIEEMDAVAMDQVRAKRLLVDARDRNLAGVLLEGAGFHVARISPERGLEITDPRALECPDDIATLLVQGNCPPTRIMPYQENLEDHFLRLTGSEA